MSPYWKRVTAVCRQSSPERLFGYFGYLLVCSL
jgi:hypothetical protein